jgi:hypothetical protein
VVKKWHFLTAGASAFLSILFLNLPKPEHIQEQKGQEGAPIYLSSMQITSGCVHLKKS